MRKPNRRMSSFNATSKRASVFPEPPGGSRVILRICKGWCSRYRMGLRRRFNPASFIVLLSGPRRQNRGEFSFKLGFGHCRIAGHATALAAMRASIHSQTSRSMNPMRLSPSGTARGKVPSLRRRFINVRDREVRFITSRMPIRRLLSFMLPPKKCLTSFGKDLYKVPTGVFASGPVFGGSANYLFAIFMSRRFGPFWPPWAYVGPPSQNAAQASIISRRRSSTSDRAYARVILLRFSCAKAGSASSSG